LFRLRFAVLLLLTVALAAPVACAWAATGPPAKQVVRPAATPATMAKGRKLYRKFCGECHALKDARAVGFGDEKKKTDPGPSFDELKVSWIRCVNAIVLSIAGHETITNEMTWQQIADVSVYVARITRDNTIPGTSAYG
jgi:mono/diheme cytochrome c family protein